MQYLLLIYQNESDSHLASETARAALSKEYMAFSADLAKSGHLRDGQGLERSTTATTVRVREGKTLTTDGPFAETREQLGGIYVVEAKDLDEAIKLAARIPSAPFGAVEVRPIRPMLRE